MNRKLSMSALKIIACISMLIDHLTYNFATFEEGDSLGYGIYLFGRCLGRPAFIIFAFALTEALFYTRSRGRYLVRLSILAVLSEPCFDFMIFGKKMGDAFLLRQNVLFLFIIAFAAIWGMEYLKEKYFVSLKYAYYFYSVLIIIMSGILVIFLGTDYGITGLLCIYVFYFTRGNNRYTVVGMILWSVVALFEGLDIEWFGLIALWPILGMYNGEKGRNLKAFFYIFYPVHMLLLTGIRFLVLGL